MPTERELLALCLRWLEHPGLIHPFDKAMLVESLKAKLQPEPRPWVGLTEQEQGSIMEDLNAYGTNLYHFAQAIEAKLKEKNS
jgi:hypothetical protein